MAGVALKRHHPPVFTPAFFWLCPTQPKSKSKHKIERFVWRLDCRLKYVYYLLVIKFVIFGYFWGKIRLFLRSLWRALQVNSPTPFSPPVSLLFYPNNNETRGEKKIERFVWRLDCRLKYVCYLIVIKFVVFDYFSGKIRLFLGSLWRALQITSVKLALLVYFFPIRQK